MCVCRRKRHHRRASSRRKYGIDGRIGMTTPEDATSASPRDGSPSSSTPSTAGTPDSEGQFFVTIASGDRCRASFPLFRSGVRTNG
jgi:hypothetical protein